MVSATIPHGRSLFSRPEPLLFYSTLNEKYEIYLDSMKRIIDTNAHKTKSTNYNKVQVIYYHLDLGGTITVYCNPLRCVIPVVCVTRWEGGGSSIQHN